MAQVYIVVYDQYGRILVGFKKAKGGRFGGVSQTPTTLNSAGQLVVPGGKQEWNETIRQGAEREFTEETGLNILKYADWITTRSFSNDSFGVAYYRCAPDYEQALVEDANTNITMNETLDEELHQLGWVPHTTALQTIRQGFSTHFIGVDDVRTLRGRSRYAFDLSWYDTAISNTPLQQVTPDTSQ